MRHLAISAVLKQWIKGIKFDLANYLTLWKGEEPMRLNSTL